MRPIPKAVILRGLLRYGGQEGKAWVERQPDDAQGGLQLGEDVGDVGLVEG